MRVNYRGYIYGLGYAIWSPQKISRERRTGLYDAILEADFYPHSARPINRARIDITRYSSRPLKDENYLRACNYVVRALAAEDGFYSHCGVIVFSQREFLDLYFRQVEKFAGRPRTEILVRPTSKDLCGGLTMSRAENPDP